MMPGPMEWLIILVVMLLLFGNRLPSVMRSLGASASEFKKGMQGIENDIHEATKPAPPTETQESKSETQA